jgi:hypothetical protein
MNALIAQLEVKETLKRDEIDACLGPAEGRASPIRGAAE